MWVEGTVTGASAQHLLSARDRADTQRITPGGTPGYAVLHLRSGWRAWDHLTLNLAERVEGYVRDILDARGERAVISAAPEDRMDEVVHRMKESGISQLSDALSGIEGADYLLEARRIVAEEKGA